MKRVLVTGGAGFIDKPVVAASLAALVRAGDYPADLFQASPA